MPIRFSASRSVGLRQQTPNRGRRALLALVAGLAAVTVLLWMNRGFIDYALTGWFWSRTEGTVIDARTTDKPSIQFSAVDGSIHVFKEDYFLLCGTRYSMCFDRNFTPGEIVPVVYGPNSSTRAFIRDWALTANVISVFIEAGIWLLLLVLLIFPNVVGRSLRMSVQIGGKQELEQTESTDF